MNSRKRSPRSLGLFAGATLALSLGTLGTPSLSIAGPSTPPPEADPITVGRIVQGKKIAPVPLDLDGKNRTLVYLGSYLVNAVGGCNDCHTNPDRIGGDPSNGDPGQVNTANYLAGGRAFGPFVSANITPDAEGKPAGLTRDEFIQTMRTGYKASAGRYLAVMPWPVYRDMTDQDLKAIYEYLSAIPHAEPPAPCLTTGASDTGANVCE